MPRSRTIARAVGVFLVAALLVPLATTGTVLASFIFLPLPATLPEPKPGIESQISRIYDADGNEIGVFRIFEQSIPVNPADIPEVLKQAVIAAEDRNFYSHGGVDVRGTARALWADVRGGEISQGGSTITQQYVKLAYTGRQRTLARKVREAILASQLDRQMDKEEILFRYLSNVYFGEGAFGVGAAAETYFRKPVSHLALSDAALLAGLIPAPSRYSPRTNPDLAEQKRNIVLDAMLGEGYITPEQHAAAKTEKLHLVSQGPPPGPATLVYPPQRQDTKYPYFVDYVRRYLEARYGRDKVFRGGLSVYTTLDPRMQDAALAATGAALAGYPPPVDTSLVAVEPPTGYVKALVGGRDFTAEQTNLALGPGGGGSGRQPGSSFKPFVMAQAFESGMTPATRYSGRSGICVGVRGDGTPYCPANYGGSNYGTVDLRTAARKSVNSVFVQLINDVGVPETMELARRMGVTTSVHDPASHGVAIALGVLEVSPLDMAAAFGVFAARGMKAPVTPVVRVLDAEGNVLEDNSQPEQERILREVVADNVNDVLKGVLQPGGTAGGRGIGRPAAGKTGTAQDAADAWFVGYTPVLSTAVWFGHREGRVAMNGVTGGSHPARTWQAFMRAALADVPATEFNEPAPLRPVADQARLQQRGGFDVGRRRYPAGPDTGGPYDTPLRPPEATPPPEATTTTSSTTTTTVPDDDDGFFP